MGTNATTATAAAAGAATGSVVGWLISLTGADPAPIMGPLAVIGAWLFGRLFPTT